MKPESAGQTTRMQQEESSTNDGLDVDNMGKIYGVGWAKGEKRKRNRTGNIKFIHRRRVFNFAWSTLLGLAAVGMLITLFFAWLLPRMQRERITAKAIESQPMVLEMPEVSRVDPRAGIRWVELAMQVSSPGEVAKYFYKGETKAEEILQFLKTKEFTHGSSLEYEWTGNLDANNMLMDLVTVYTLEDTVRRERLAFLRQDDQQEWKLDFDSFARKCEPSWEDFASGKASEALIRVHIAEDNFYNGFFSDEQQWVCYSIANPDHPAIIQAYCRASSPQDHALKWILKKNNMKRARVSLRVERPALAPVRQVIVAEVVAEDWVIGTKNFDTNF